jgi:hypothetical protein
MTELDAIQEYNILLENTVTQYASKIAKLEKHCIWLAVMIENWTDDELKKDFEVRGKQVYMKVGDEP